MSVLLAQNSANDKSAKLNLQAHFYKIFCKSIKCMKSEKSKLAEVKTPKFSRIFFSSSLEKQATLIVPLLNILKAAGKLFFL